MNNEKIKRIKGIAKACRIISRIAQVLCVIGAVFSFIGVGIISAIPADIFKITGNVDASVVIDLEDIPFSSDTLETVAESQGVVIGEEKIDIDDIMSLILKSKQISENKAQLDVTGDLSELSVKEIKQEIAIETVSAGLLLICAAIFLTFAVSLSKEIENSDSPFTSEIVRKAKAFGYSLIPYGVFGGVGNGSIFTTALFVLVIIMLINIFAYGAELQKESDETL